MSKLENIAAIANENVTTVKARFSWDGQQKNAGEELTWKVMKSFLETNKVVIGDSLVAESKNGLSVIVVTEIHDEAEIDPSSDIKYVWAFQKVNMETLSKLHNGEGNIVRALFKAQQQNARRQAIAALFSKLGIDEGSVKTTFSLEDSSES